MISSDFDAPQKRDQARQWFAALRDRTCIAFEAIEDMHTAGLFSDLPAGRFIRTDWSRPEGGGGTMAVMKGRVFEKVGVNISVVHGEFSEKFRQEIPGAAEDPRFWAAGISLVAHLRSPLVPAVHMNTRMICVGEAAAMVASDESTEAGPGEPAARHPKHFAWDPTQTAAAHGRRSSADRGERPNPIWFGGGADLNPMIPDDADTADFHAAFQATCDGFDPTYYPKFKAWCDEYFFIPHRNEARGVGGIFYDYLKADWERDFAFTRAVGETFLNIYPALVNRHRTTPWGEEQRALQLRKRGRYAEFNLVYDRGTRFGLMTGGNPEAILMSLPPLAVWE